MCLPHMFVNGVRITMGLKIDSFLFVCVASFILYQVHVLSRTLTCHKTCPICVSLSHVYLFMDTNEL